MMKQRVTLLALPLTVLLVIGTAAWKRPADPSRPAAPAWTELDTKAVAASIDQQATRDLVHTISLANDVSDNLSGVTQDLEDRVVRSELRFRQGLRNPITETGVANVVNGLADEINAPAYAHTNDAEVRRLRVLMLPTFPHLIGTETVTVRKDSIRKGFTGNMSPAEAFLVTGTLIRQKLFNSDFQQTPTERRAILKTRHTTDVDHSKEPLVNARSDELLGLVNKHAATLSYPDMLQRVNHYLDVLQMEK